MWYAQTDPRWSNQRLGTCDGVTIGSDGCFVTAFANMANDCGKDITPAALDDIFTNSGYVDGCLCSDNMLTVVYPDIVYSSSSSYNGPADLSQLNNDVTVKQILEVDGYPNTPGLQTHFVYFHHIDNGTVWIIDSETGLLSDLSLAYGDPATAIYKIVTYSFNPPVAVPAPPPPPVDPDPILPPPHQAPVVSVPPVTNEEIPMATPTPAPLVHPKVVAAGGGSAFVALVLGVLAAHGVHLPQVASDLLVALSAFVSGYFKSA